MSLLMFNQMHEAQRNITPPTDDHRYQRDMIEDIRTGLDLALNFKQDIDALHPYIAHFVHKLFNY